jgi:hypothetical protein
MSTPPRCPTPRKHAHATQRGALRHLAELRRVKPLGMDWNVYECRCGAWHIGHKPGSLARRARRALIVRRRR